MELVVLGLDVVEELPLANELFQSEVVEVFVGDKKTVVKFIDLIEQRGTLTFELQQFIVCEEVGRGGELLQLVLELLHLFCAFLGFRFQVFLFSDSEERNDSCDEDDDGYDESYDIHEIVLCVCHPFGWFVECIFVIAVQNY